jgi:hypothetical protein
MSKPPGPAGGLFVSPLGGSRHATTGIDHSSLSERVAVAPLFGWRMTTVSDSMRLTPDEIRIVGIYRYLLRKSEEGGVR